MIADMETLARRKIKIEKLAKSGNKEARMHLKVIEKVIENLNNNSPARVIKGFSE